VVAFVLALLVVALLPALLDVVALVLAVPDVVVPLLALLGLLEDPQPAITNTPDRTTTAIARR
jgi:hypothetical protein